VYKYTILLGALLVTGCSPKSNPDKNWKADCAKYYSHSKVDYMLCMERKMKQHNGEEQPVKADPSRTPAQGPQKVQSPVQEVDLTIKKSPIGYQKDRLSDVKDQEMDEESGASNVL